MSYRSLLVRNGLKLLILVLTSAWIITLPEPEPESLLHYKNAIVVLVGVVWAGKILYDTLFYDRYA